MDSSPKTRKKRHSQKIAFIYLIGSLIAVLPILVVSTYCIGGGGGCGDIILFFVWAFPLSAVFLIVAAIWSLISLEPIAIMHTLICAVCVLFIFTYPGEEYTVYLMITLGFIIYSLIMINIKRIIKILSKYV